jgi:Tfp pilus assembly protein PilF
MMRSVFRASVGIERVARPRCLAFVGVLVAAAIVASPTTGLAQAPPQPLTTATLIGDAVPEVGAKHSDIDEAIKFFLNRDALGARALIEEARKKDPTLPPSDLILAKMYFVTGVGAAGRAALEKTVNENPGDPEAYLIIGDQDFSQGGTIEAEALYDKALALNEKFNENPKRKRNFSIRGLWGRAAVAERRKNWRAMGSDLQALLRIDEHHAAARYKMGVALCMLNNFVEGKKAFEAARKNDKNLPNPSLSVALINDRLGKQDDARKAFADALREEPTDLNTMANYAQWLIKTGSLDEAEKVLATARNAHPDSLEVFVLSGAAARMNGKPKEAEQFFVSALGMSPAHSGVINQLALLLVNGDDKDKNRALQFAGMNARINNQSADAHITLSWVYFKLGNAAQASESLKTGLQQGALNQDSSFLVASMLSEQQAPEQKAAAKRLLSDALTAESPGIFIHRKEAQELLKKLGG